MKKIIVFLLIIASMFGLASCKKDDEQNNQPNDTTQGGDQNGNQNGDQNGDENGDQDGEKESQIQKILDEAASLADGETLSGDRTVTGTVKSIKDAYSSQYKNITFILTDGTADILVFRSKGDCAASLKVGDEVTVTGEVINYGGTIEFQYAALTTDNDNNNTENEKVELSTVAQVLEAAKDLENKASLPKQYKVTGTVSSFKKEFSYNGGEYYTFNLTDSTGTIYIYSPEGDALATLKDGDTVFVKGNVKKYNDIIEFDSALVSFADDFDLSNVEKLTAEEKTPIIPEEVEGTYDFISIPMALAIAKDGGEDFESKEKYYITGWVSNVNSHSFGSITITDGNVSIFAYGISDYVKNNEWPLLGDVVVVEAVIGTKGTDVELKNASKLVEWHKVDVDTTEYEEATITEARNANAGEKLIIEGTVVSFTYKNAKGKDGKYVRDGLYLVSGSNSIYLYGASVASSVEVGNTIKVAGVKEYFIQEKEIGLAEKYNFTGACQLSDVLLISNDNGNTSVLENAFETTTVKALMEKEFDENVTTQIFKVNALIKKSYGADYINYYIDDLDEKTGTYTYTKCNGGDFAWLDSYLNKDGQYLCTLLVSLCNAKATSSGCNWRLVPIAILSDYTFDTKDSAQFVLDYYALPQFVETYFANPAIELITSHSSALLGFENVTISYVSDNAEVVSIDEVDGQLILNANKIGEANVTITVTYNGESVSETIKLIRDGEPTFDALTVKEAIDSTVGETITVEGIVGPGIPNTKTAFYLIDETGVIAVKFTTTDELAKVAQGNRIVITGKREQYKSSNTYPGQTSVVDVELVHNYYGEHEYSTATFQESTLAELAAVSVSENKTTQVFIVEATAALGGNGQTVVISNGSISITLYANGIAQNQWLVDAVAGKTLKMEVALCNWNARNPYKACVLAVYLEDGTKVINQNNFQQ